MEFDIKAVAELSKLNIDKSEAEKLESDMQKIISFIESCEKGNC